MRERLSVAFALILCMFMIATSLPSVLSAGITPGTHTFIEEGAEEATFEEWDARWERYDANNDPISGQDWWCRQMHEVHSGMRSIYCARNGINSHYLNSTGHQPWNVNLTSLPESVSQTNYVLRYDTNQDSIIRKPVTGAKYYNTVTMTFWFYSDTGRSDAKQPDTNEPVGYDFLNAIYYTGTGDGKVKHVLWTDTYEQATAKTWTQISVTVPNDVTMVGFEFVSGTIAPEGGDASDAFSAQGITVVNGGMKEGVFLDDISVVGTGPAPDVPLVTSVDSLPVYENNRSFPVNIVDNDPQVGLKYAYLYYRMAGQVNWTKYTTPENYGGTFSVFPIMFVAPQDGTYQFFSVGVDGKDVVEERRNAADESTVVDTTAPVSVISINGDGKDGNYSGAVSFNITSSDAASGVDRISYRVDGGAWMDYAASVGLATSGKHVIEYFATDLAGNTELTKSYELSIENGSAGIVFQDGSNKFSDGNVTIGFTVASSSDIAKLEYSLDGGEPVVVSATTTSLSFTGLGDGDHRLVVKATDTNGTTIRGEYDFTVGKSGSSVGGFIGDILGQPLVLAGIAIVAIVTIGGMVWLVRRKKN